MRSTTASSSGRRRRSSPSSDGGLAAGASIALPRGCGAPEDATPTWSWSAPGSRAWSPLGSWPPAAARCWCWRRATGSAAAPSTPRSAAGKVIEMGGQWVGPTQDRVLALAAELGVETFPTYYEGRNLLDLGGQAPRLQGDDPAAGAARAARHRAGAAEARQARRGVSAEAPWRPTRADELDSQTLHTWIASAPAPKRARALLEVAVGTVMGIEQRRALAALDALLRQPAGGFDALIDVEGGAQQDRFAGRLAGDLDPARGGARRRGRARGPGARDRPGRRRGGGRGRGLSAPRPASDRRGAAAAGGANLLLASARRPARPAAAAHGPRGADQVRRRLRRALLARAWPHRPGGQRRRPDQHHLRQLAAGRLAGGDARVHRRGRGDPPRPAERGRAPAARARLLRPPLR